MTSTSLPPRTAGGVGDQVTRPDAVAKVRGEFVFSSDLWMDGMLYGATLRSPHAHARILRVETSRALATPGVRAVLTHEDVPGVNAYGLEIADQPVLAIDVVRYQGEPVAVVAADDPEVARAALARIEVDYEVLAPVTDARAAARGETPARTDGRGPLVRHLRIRKGDPAASAPVVVRGEYETGMQDQTFLGPESGLAVPTEDGGVHLHVATQWLHVDRRQVAPALGLREEQVVITLAGVGGSFGGREDLSMQIHAGMLALRTGRPVRMVYSREESFLGHVHRHPAWLRYEHGADESGRLVYVRAEVVLDGGAYASSTQAVVGNTGTLGVGPYDVPHVAVDVYGAYTNNPPCGAMRGFGAVQAAFAYESQMDRLAAAVGLDPAEVRIRNALAEGGVTPTGQRLDSPAPVAELVRRVRDLPLPPPASADPRSRPGGLGNTTHGEGVVRGVGYGVSMKNVCFSAGMDDSSTARVRLAVVDGAPLAVVHTAAVDVGQGLVVVQEQVARTELGTTRVTVATPDTLVGDAGSTSASRQTYMTTGSVRAACREVAAELLSRAATRSGLPADALRLADDAVVGPHGVVSGLAELLAGEAVDRTVVWRHRPTTALDPETGQGDTHVQFVFSAHRAVVDVDTELGLVKVVALDCVQDVGRVVNPTGARGQVLGGSVQGLGLAVMEEVELRDGLVLNPSFTDYLVPTAPDVPPMHVELLEHPDPHAPYGVRGMGEAPTISATPAVVAAIRDATGLPLTRVPVRPEHLVPPR
ncbi:MAG TPA: xanthine dehydrogenase subunit D [Nocardioides sp.]|uniref:xanthine dehydrogenase subunit D n=1 Tax=Nocardioides sp. TaxID=35761 RepID=UPI002C674436|nr:xanthine dehydrogenase subunit D [Nocardioides sp.]HQR25592.1 xanthine dehydrogenase subunit D [Nocardioides sp.]